MKAPRVLIAKIAADKLTKSAQPKKIAKELAAYLLQTNRVNELNSLIRDIAVEWADQGIVEVSVKAAHDLNKEQLDTLKAQVKKIYPEAKRIDLNVEIIPELIGGIEVVFANKQLDLSLKSKINQFKYLAMSEKD